MWVQYQKWQNDLGSFQGKQLKVTVIQIYTPTTNVKEVEVERFYEDLQELLELASKKRCFFHHKGLECKSRKYRGTWSDRQIWLWSTKWNRAKDNRVLPREDTCYSKHSLPITHETALHMDITRWWILKSDLLYSLQLKKEKFYTVKKKIRPGADLWLRYELPIANADLHCRK